MARKRHLIAYLLPAVALVTLFFLVPLGYVLYMSTTEWAGLGDPKFIGIDNFTHLFGDRAFMLALKNTLLWVAVGVFVHTPLCLLVALILARRPRMWKLLRTIYFVQNVISSTALAFLWYFVFHVNLGLLNKTLETVGLGGLSRAWLFDPNTALWATQLPFVIYIGFGMVLFLAQISTIPRELYEAAALDGASAWRQDLYITIPLIRRAIALQSLFVVGFALRVFEYPFLMTGGGPADQTTTLSLYIYRQMVTANAYGLSMAAGVVTLAVGVVLTALVLVWVRRTERVA